VDLSRQLLQASRPIKSLGGRLEFWSLPKMWVSNGKDPESRDESELSRKLRNLN
jgi:hypothetical protein